MYQWFPSPIIEIATIIQRIEFHEVRLVRIVLLSSLLGLGVTYKSTVPRLIEDRTSGWTRI
jgi:hypothetical protein